MYSKRLITQDWQGAQLQWMMHPHKMLGLQLRDLSTLLFEMNVQGIQTIPTCDSMHYGTCTQDIEGPQVHRYVHKQLWPSFNVCRVILLAKSAVLLWHS